MAEEIKRLVATFALGPIHVPAGGDGPVGPSSGATGPGATAAPGVAADATASIDASPASVTLATGPTLVSLFLQRNPRYSAPGADATCTLLAGAETIEESMCGLRFSISPQSFFQVNTRAAEQLYTRVAALLAPTPSSVLYDVCCGTGTIGLTMARIAHEVVGVEVCEPAVEDARKNAVLNAIGNATFVVGPAETVLSEQTRKPLPPGASESLAVVDPPRAGKRVVFPA
jgi:tRNA/tmRNA/rRNA uracil-C5-methylase (TrmA/RlmC/RlmD family)